MDHLSQATQVRVRGPAAYLLSRVTWACARCHAGSRAVQVYSGPSLKARVVDQLSQALGPVSEGTWVRPGSPEIALESDGPWGRPYVPGDIGPGPMARVVHQQARTTQALF